MPRNIIITDCVAGSSCVVSEVASLLFPFFYFHFSICLVVVNTNTNTNAFAIQNGWEIVDIYSNAVSRLSQTQPNTDKRYNICAQSINICL